MLMPISYPHANLLSIVPSCLPVFYIHELILPPLHCTENLKLIFPEMKLHCLIPIFYIYVSVSNLYIPTIGTQQTDRRIL
jgi:hypothetical protein